MNKLPKSKRKSLVLILEALSSEDGDELVAGDLHMQSATHGLSEREEVGEYRISMNIVECQVNKMELETYKELTGPHPCTLSASPCMQFLANSHPQAQSFILVMLPDTRAGVTLLSEALVLARGISTRLEMLRRSSW